MIELSSLYTVDDHGAGAEMRVKDVNGKPTELYITFVGIDSEKWDDVQAEFRHKQADAIREGGRKNSKVKSEMLAAAAIGWRGAGSNGVDVEFSVENVGTLLFNAPYVRAQADDFIATRVNFTKGQPLN